MPIHRGTAARRRFAQRLCALLALLLADPAAAMRQFGTRDGLVPNSAFAIVRDDLGFLWAGADSGLTRFDGRRFAAPPAAIAEALDGLIITTMASDGDILWIGTRSAGLRRVDLRHERVEAIAPQEGGLPATAIRAIAIDAAHSVWIATDGAGVVHVDWQAGNSRFVHYSSESGGLPHERVWSIAVDGSTILAGTQEGAARLLPGAARFETLMLPAPFPQGGATNIEKFIGDGRGGYWIGTWDHGLFHADIGGVRHIDADDRALSPRITSLAMVDGSLMVGLDSGLARYLADCDCLREIPLTSGYDSIPQIAFVRSLLPLEDGSVYVGTWGNGVFHVPPNESVFEAVRPIDPIGSAASTRRVQSMLEDRRGRLWVGSFGSGLQRTREVLGRNAIQLESMPIASNADPAANRIWILHEDRAGRIWVGSDAGLDRYDPESQSWRHVAPSPDDAGLPGQGIRDLFELDSGEMLVGTSSGLARIDGQDHAHPIRYAGPGPNHALANTISAIARDGRGRWWLASYYGVQVLDANYRLLHVFHKPQLPQDLVRDLLDDGRGQMLIAAGKLCRVDTRAENPAAVEPICAEQELGLPGDDIQALEIDAEGALWLSSLHGLRRIPPRAGPTQAFYAADGLIADEFATGASHAGRSGRLYFGSAYGLQVFDPRAIRTPERTLTPVLTEIRVGGRALDADDISDGGMLDAAPPYARMLRLAPGHRDVLLGFSLLGANRDEQRLQYRIDGLHDWLPAAEAGIGNYLNLPHGTYQVSLRVHESGLPPGAEMRLLSLRVPPYWWERTSIQVLLVATLLGAAWFAYRKRIVSLRNNQRWLRNQVTLRTREIEQQKRELALANQQLYELSIHDGLTGVFNRRHCLDETRRVLRERGEVAICIALIDLDHFKSINDRFGHVSGDEALRGFARLLSEHAGPGDVVGRYGGEEFVCLLQNRDIEQARHWAERLLAAVRAAQIAGSNCDIHLTASIGLVAIGSGTGLPLEVWIARADAALYRAKANGRDQVLLG